MKSQPDFYSLEFASDTDFWAHGGNSARRTLLMPLPNPLEFIAFGVLAPSNEVLFVARGRVADHLGDFIGRMEQAQARVELYARVPLPGSIVNPYVKDDSHDQKEADDPPPPPTLLGDAVLSTGGNPVQLSSGSNLWTLTGLPRQVLIKAVSGSSQSLAFGMVKVNDRDYLWRVSFVARLGSDYADFVKRMTAEGATVYSPSATLPTVWNWYEATYLTGQTSLAA